MPRTVVRHEEQHLYAEGPATPAGRELSHAVLDLRRADRLQAERAQRASGLPSLDLLALRYLVQGYRDERNLSPKDLIVMLGTSSATVTNIVDRLVARSLLVREQHPHDRRAHFLRPTPDAIRRVDDSYTGYHTTLVEAINQIDDEEALCAARVVARIAEALDATADTPE